MQAWRDSGLRPQVFGLDAWVVVGWAPFIFHIRLWTLALGVGVTAFFAALKYFGYSLDAAGRAIVVWLSGDRLRARPQRRYLR